MRYVKLKKPRQGKEREEKPLARQWFETGSTEKLLGLTPTGSDLYITL